MLLLHFSPSHGVGCVYPKIALRGELTPAGGWGLSLCSAAALLSWCGAVRGEVFSGECPRQADVGKGGDSFRRKQVKHVNGALLEIKSDFDPV